MGKLYSFSKSDALAVAYSNARDRCNFTLRDTIGLFAEEGGQPQQQSVMLAAWMRADREGEELLAKDTAPLIVNVDDTGRMAASEDEVVHDLIKFILQLPPVFRIEIFLALKKDADEMEAHLNSIKPPQDAPDSEQ